MDFQGDTRTADLALALGVAGGPAGRPGDRLRHARQRRQGDRPHDDPRDQGRERQGRRRSVRAAGRQAGHQPAGGLHRHRHPGRQHQPNVNPFWGKFAINGPDGGRRPATLKTGTNNDAKDLNAYGYIAPPTDERSQGRGVRARGRRLERQLGQQPRLDRRPAAVLDRRLDVRLAGLPPGGHQGLAGQTNFERPDDGLVKVAIDPFTGLPAAPGDKAVDEWFIAGTRARRQAWRRTRAASTSLDRLGYETKFDELDDGGP